ICAPPRWRAPPRAGVIVAFGEYSLASTGGRPMTGLGNSLSTLPNFLAYFASGTALVALFVSLYALSTPQRDVMLIRAGNSAAAIGLVGALLGFILPLASVIAHSAGIIDLVV